MKKAIIISVVIVVSITVFFLVMRIQDQGSGLIQVPVKNGVFEVFITSTGELEAKQSIEITALSGLRDFRIREVTIQHIIEEGSKVSKGDYVAQLDPSEFMNKIQDQKAKVEQARAESLQRKLDVNLQSRQAKDKLVNLEYEVQDKQSKLEQSQYEPPSVIKQAEHNLAKAKRDLAQEKEINNIKNQQNSVKINQSLSNLWKEKRTLIRMEQMLSKFTIKAPHDGMLIYRKSFDGKPIKEGAKISTFDPVVATLPDLSTMISKTYVNEVDIRKVKVGQNVDVRLDAFPNKKWKGKVISVANVGEEHPTSNAKVFAINIEIAGNDPLLRPAMTTSNVIKSKVLIDVLSLPLDCVHTHQDTINYVFVNEGSDIIKKEILIGDTNADEAVILLGLEVYDMVYLTVPRDMESVDVVLNDQLNGKRTQTISDDYSQDISEENNNKIMFTLPNGVQVPLDTTKQ